MKGAEGLKPRGIEAIGIPLAFQNIGAIAAVGQDEVQLPTGFVFPIAYILIGPTRLQVFKDQMLPERSAIIRTEHAVVGYRRQPRAVATTRSTT